MIEFYYNLRAKQQSPNLQEIHTCNKTSFNFDQSQNLIKSIKLISLIKYDTQFFSFEDFIVYSFQKLSEYQDINTDFLNFIIHRNNLLYSALNQFDKGMLGDNLNKNGNQCEKNSFISQFQDTKINQLLRQKDQEIKNLKKTVKKLQKELKQKAVAEKNPQLAENQNQYLTAMMQGELKRYNELKEIVIDVTERMRKLSISIDSQYSLSQNSQSLQNMVKMLNLSEERDVSGSSMTSSQMDEEDKQEYLQLSRAFEGLQVMMKSFQMKFNQLKNQRKNILGQFKKSRSQHDDEVQILQKDLKEQIKKKELLQKILQTNEKQKNELVNNINNILAKSEMVQLQKKQKEQIIKYAQKLNYRIKDLQDEKLQYLKINSKDKEVEMKLYQGLLSQVKNIKEKSRFGKSLSINQ